ncbi:hypothetical protein QBC36DRAFT_290995 [Triangularia setosa]|uniref:Uncharacterized protein n=1 Tax=Triangularia setosa TaxID=2587417 RepID=A0AAN6W896_9PEZI|nr:hypothetical protein QBC36DRAFT_290995 [Podospora setosa]
MADKKTTDKLVEKGVGKWNNESHEALVVGLYNILLAENVSPANNKDVVVATMARMGQPYTWEAIRYPQHQLPKMVRWNDQSNLDLLSCLYGMYSKDMGKEVQTAVVAEMKSKGHDDINWDKIRYVSICWLPSDSSSLYRPSLSGLLCLALPSGAASSRPFPSSFEQAA